MEEKTFKAAVGLRGDCLYCPLPLSIDSYWNCEADCHHCYMRRLNRTWGQDLRPADPEDVRKTLQAGLKNPNPKSSLAYALKLKKTIRLGNKTDPFQTAETHLGVSARIIAHLNDLRWTYVIQSRFLANLRPILDLLDESHRLGLLTLMPVISPGAEWDWEVLERKRTTPIDARFRFIHKALLRGWNVGVNGEPFIPGLHTTDQFRDMCKRLNDVGVESYNTYNLHFNDHVAKRLHSIGIDIEKIWHMNQDKNWRPIQQKLCQIADEVGIRLGCPDFVNTGPHWRERANTCCGVNVPNPSQYNTHYWKALLQQGKTKQGTDLATWEGIGDRDIGLKILQGEKCDRYTMKDAGVIQ
jgi:DNA repair photolyase